jgi:hypothetical protein
MQLSAIPSIALGAICWIAVLVASPPTTFAQSVVAVDGRGGVYLDNDATTIVTSAVGARVEPHPRLSIQGEYLIDVVSTASVDVVAAATGRWEELRHQGSGSVGYRDPERRITGGYIASVENDWESHTGTLSMAHDALDHQLTIGLSGSFGYNEVGRSGDPNFDRQLLLGSAGIEAAIIASKDDLLSIGANFLVAVGYQGSPYRYVRFFSSSNVAAIAEPESPPEERYRNALSLRWNHHLGGSVLRSSARAYLDNWGVVSGTLGLDWAIEAGDFEIVPSVRAYMQKSATFYREIYMERRSFMTADRELATFFDVFAGLGAGYRATDLGALSELRIDAKVTGFYFKFLDYYPSPERLGLIAELAVEGGAESVYFLGLPQERGWDCTLCHLEPPRRIGARITSIPPELIAEGTFKPGELQKIIVEMDGESLGARANVNSLSFALIKPDGSLAATAVKSANAFSAKGQEPMKGADNLPYRFSDGLLDGANRWEIEFFAPCDGEADFFFGIVDGNGAGDVANKNQDPQGDDVVMGKHHFRAVRADCPMASNTTPNGGGLALKRASMGSSGSAGWFGAGIVIALARVLRSTDGRAEGKRRRNSQ